MADANPFIEHRRHLDVYGAALAAGMTDTDYCTAVSEADARVAAVDGVGFVTTPIVLLDRPTGPGGNEPVGSGPVVAKVETANVAGSHKARHLFGLLLRLLVEEATGPVGERPAAPPALAIASCGNAALGAAVVAKAAERRLLVFVPTDADAYVLDRLNELGAEVQACPRTVGEQGDPCIAALDRALAGGAKAFTVQGPTCPDVIDGGRTLGLELAAQLDDLGIEPGSLYVQIGGGALATATMDGLVRAWPDRRPPRLMPVQAERSHPYVAALRALTSRIIDDLGVSDPGTDAERAALLLAERNRFDLAAALAHNADVMRPWPETPHSVASGILDDITYDWQTVANHQIDTGGHPVLVDEATFSGARDAVADLVDPPPDETGAAGLAGLLTHFAAAPTTVVWPAVVLLTGVVRDQPQH